MSCLAWWSAAHAAPAVTSLRVDYGANPLGVSARAPRLSWTVTSDRRGTTQSAYQVLAAGTEAALAADRGDLWDSGKVASDQSQWVPYGGPALGSRQRVWVKVRVWDDHGEVGVSAPSWFETGLTQPADWRAKWITRGSATPTAAATAPPPPAAAGPVDFGKAHWIWSEEAEPPAGPRYLRTVIHIPADIGINKATLALTVDDQFTCWLNGEEVVKSDGKGDSWRRPITTDLARKLHMGPNVLAVMGVNASQGAAGLLLRLDLDLSIGKQTFLSGPEGWRVSKTEVAGWKTQAFDDRAWAKATDQGQVGVAPWGTPGGGGPTSAAPRPTRPPAPAAGPCPLLRRPFRVDKPLSRARLYMSALGVYAASLNGQRVGGAVFAPEWTDYRKRVQYNTYDVTAQVKPGDNVLGAILGDGWYCGHVGLGGRNRYGTHPALLAQLMLDYADGTTETIASDESWKQSTGPLLTSDLLDGETYDARKELPGWDAPGFNDAAWTAAAVEDPKMGALEEPVGPAVEKLLELPAKALTEPAAGRYTVDFGQNLVGYVRLRASAPAGTTVTLRFAEMLKPDGTLYTVNYRGARCTDTYTCKGGGPETFEPRFTFRGFRYCEVTGLPAKPALDQLTAVVVGSALPTAGSLTCSDGRLNQLVSNIVWGQRGNFLSVPTDCPQRDERLGWTGDAQIFCRTATSNNNVAGFFAKWLKDLDDSQSAAGAYPDVSPRVAAGDGTAAWGDAGVICPWVMYQCYGDPRFLEDHYPAMVKWVEYCRANSKELLRPAKGYGDWLAIGANTPKEVLATAYFAWSTQLVARSAKILGKTDDAAKYGALFDDIAKAFRAAYVNADGTVKGGSQTGYLLALRFGLLTAEQQPLAAKHLVADIAQRGNRLSTGFVGVGHLLPTLTQCGRGDVAWQLLTQEAFPSWLFSVKQGATTIWERWDGWTPDKGFQNPGMNSFNHYSFGSCGEWMYENLLGIAPDPSAPGYRRIVCAPRPGGGVTWAKGWYDSGYGRIGADWKVDGGTFTLKLEVPVGVTARVTLPVQDANRVTESGAAVQAAATSADGPVYELASGSYSFAGPAK